MGTDDLDGVLFRYWVRKASEEPGRTAQAIARCLTPDEYRHALLEMAREDRLNLPEPQNEARAGSRARR
jgi:hypothetical protein